MITEKGLKKAISKNATHWKAYYKGDCVAAIKIHGGNKWTVDLKDRQTMKVENEETILKIIAAHETDPRFDTEYIFGEN